MPRNSPLRQHDMTYPPARGTVLLLTCMDLRVLDEIVDFMDHDNLSNRYDHVVFAGAALGVIKGCSPPSDGSSCECRSHWRDVFFQQLDAAIALHDVKDVYILEHRHCGAYHAVFQVGPEFGESEAEQEAEAALHYEYAAQLRDEIIAWGEARNRPLGVRLFIMDLRGHVEQLAPPDKSSAKLAKLAKKSGKAKKTDKSGKRRKA